MRVTFTNSPGAKPKVVIILAASVVILAALAASARAWLAPAADARPPRPAEAQAQAPAQARTPDRRIEAEIITLRPNGFDPAEITRPAGEFLLTVDNRSGVHELDLRLDREGGGRQHEARTPKGKRGWNRLVNLPPGRYTLSEANHPDWVCRVTITDAGR